MSGNYQSRVFTFVSRSTDRLKDSCAKGLRHLKVAVVWSGQMLLSPLHWLAQTTKIFQPQLPPPRQQPILSQQPASDINIEQALELVKVAGYPVEITQNGTSTLVELSEIEITQPKSSLTVDRSVTDPTLSYPTNGIVAVEVPQEITYTRSRQITAPKKSIRGLSSLLSDRQLVLVTNENELLDILTLAQQQEIRRRIGLDIALAWHQWQTVKLAGSGANKLSGNRRLALAGERDLERELPPPNLFDRLTDWFKKKPKPPHPPSVQLENIRSNSQQSPGQLPPTQYSFIPQPPHFDRFLDLPQLPPITEEDSSIAPDNAIGQIIAKFQPKWFDRLWNYYRDYVYIPAPTDSAIVYQPPQEFELIPIDPKPSKIVSSQRDRTELQSDRPETTRQLQESTRLAKKNWQNLEYQPDWIEAISEEIGYSQTPFARFLAWLDRIVLAIENWAIELWNKITNARSAD
jgi:hypothetical protein